MTPGTFCRVASVVFALFAIAHLMRALFAVPIIIDGWVLPVAMSWVAFVVAGGLSLVGFRAANVA